MDSLNISSFPQTLKKSPADLSPNTRSLHDIPPQIFSKNQTTLSSMHIPHKPIKQQSKHVRKLKVSPPSTESFWEILSEFQSRTTDIQKLKKTAKFMQKIKILTNLSISLNTITPFDLTYGLSRFQYLQSISALDLKITRENHLIPSNIKTLNHALASLKNLKRVSIELPELSKVPFELLDSICFALRRLVSLAHLSLKFNSLWGFGDLHIKRLAFHLKKLSQLKSLSLDLNKSTEITNTGLQPLSEIFKNLPLLSDFSIHLRSFQGCSVSTFNELFSGLATCKSLQKLDFSLMPNPGCHLRSIEPYSLGLHQLDASSLREITLKLYKDFNDYGMTQLSKALTRFSSLKTLSIEFPQDPSISNKGLSQLSSALQTITSLSTLSLLSLRSCQALQVPNLPPQNPGFGFQGQFFGASHFPQSDELSRPIDLISQGIAPLKQLENLHLDLAGCFGEKSTTMRTFSTSLQNLKSLKKLNLNLAVCRFVEDEDITLLTQGLEMLKDLTHLEVNVQHIQTLTNQTVITFISSFSKLPKLDHLTLKLGNNKTDDNVPKIIAQGLKNIPALSSLDLDFSHVNESSYSEGVGVLCGSLQNLVSLKKIALELKATNSVIEKIKGLQKVKLVTMTWR